MSNIESPSIDSGRTVEQYDGKVFYSGLRAATNWLNRHAAQINRQNVFSKPDYDTGTNLTATMLAGIDRASKLVNPSVAEVARAMAHGTLLGARGDSGVILAQFFGGASTAYQQAGCLDANSFAASLTAASKTLWQGVARPREGTILTVCEDAARAAHHALECGVGLRQMLCFVAQAARQSVARTGGLPPTLAGEGVVDAGGLGFAIIVEGLSEFANGSRLVRLSLYRHGGLSACSRGERVSVIAVANGVGLCAAFRHFGASDVVTGGQTMNPSAADLLQAIEGVPCEEVIVLPNNRNVILAARQAADLSLRKVLVLPTASVCQGLAALQASRHSLPLEELFDTMAMAISGIHTVEITTAARRARFDETDVNEGDAIALVDDKLTVSGDSEEDVATAAVSEIVTPNTKVVELYYGETKSEEQANLLAARLHALKASGQVHVAYGGQPHYSYLIAVK